MGQREEAKGGGEKDRQTHIPRLTNAALHRPEALANSSYWCTRGFPRALVRAPECHGDTVNNTATTMCQKVLDLTG